MISRHIWGRWVRMDASWCTSGADRQQDCFDSPWLIDEEAAASDTAVLEGRRMYLGGRRQKWESSAVPWIGAVLLAGGNAKSYMKSTFSYRRGSSFSTSVLCLEGSFAASLVASFDQQTSNCAKSRPKSRLPRDRQIPSRKTVCLPCRSFLGIGAILGVLLVPFLPHFGFSGKCLLCLLRSNENGRSSFANIPGVVSVMSDRSVVRGGEVSNLIQHC